MMRRALGIAATLALAAPLVACSGDGTSPGPAADARAADARTDSGMMDAAPRPDRGPPPPAAIVCGKARLIGGGPLPGVQVQVCNERICYSNDTGTDGAFCVSVDGPGTYRLHIPDGKLGSGHHGDPIFPMPVTAADIKAKRRLDVGEVLAPMMSEKIVVDHKGGGTATFKDGTRVVVPAGATKLPLGERDLGLRVSQVAGKWIHKRLLASAAGASRAVLALTSVPFETTFTSPVSYSFTPKGATLKAGTRLRAWLANANTGVLEPHGEAVVTAAGRVESVPGKGLRALGWLVFAPR